MIVPDIELNNGLKIPSLGLGVFEPDFDQAKTFKAVSDALEVGYRHIDTAAIYGNEMAVGEAIKGSGIPRAEIFITSKVWNDDQGFESTLKAYEESLSKLKTDYLDLYLIHWPVKEKRKETWAALEKIYSEGRVKAIGVSNYLVPHLTELFEYANIVPAINQIEFTPFCFMEPTELLCKEKGIILESYSPLVRGLKKDHPILNQLAQKYQKDTFQILIRWAIDHGIVTIPESNSKERLISNANVFDFKLLPEEIALLNTLHDGTRVAEDPMDFL